MMLTMAEQYAAMLISVDSFMSINFNFYNVQTDFIVSCAKVQ